MTDFLLTGGGLFLLFAGGEKLVQGSVAIAGRLGLSTLLVSLVIVGFGTSAPELLVSFQAAFAGAPAIAIGNVIGSNICNILLILGLAAVLAPVACGQPAVRRDAAAGAVAAALLAALSFTGGIGRAQGLGLAAALAFYLAYAVAHEKKTTRAEKEAEEDLARHIEEDTGAENALPLRRAAVMALLSLAALVAGAKMLVTGAVSIARHHGVPEEVIGLTLVAVGTSLPELATAIAAARRKHGDVVMGNVLGSNLFNVLAILGLTALAVPIPFAGQLAAVDVWVMLAVSVALLALVFARGRIGRAEGAVFLALYAGYLAWLAGAGA